MKPIDLLCDFISKTLSASQDYLTKEHFDVLKEGEGSGDTTCVIDVSSTDAVMVDYHASDWGAPWMIQLVGGMPAALTAAGWGDLAALVQLGLDAGCDMLELCPDTPRFPDDAVLGLTARED